MLWVVGDSLGHMAPLLVFLLVNNLGPPNTCCLVTEALSDLAQETIFPPLMVGDDGHGPRTDAEELTDHPPFLAAIPGSFRRPATRPPPPMTTRAAVAARALENGAKAAAAAEWFRQQQ